MAFLLAPAEEIRAVTVVPMFWPMMMGTAALKVTAPVEDKACRMPTAAEEDCRIAVSTAPATTPNRGLVKARNRSMNHSSPARGLMEVDMVFMPAIRMAKPIMILPTPRLRSLPSMYIQMPMKPRMGLQALGLSIWVTKLSPSRPDRDRSQPVTVVPMLAPMMTPMAWCSCIRPELTKPTAMTVVAPLDWITAVTTRPSSRPLMGEEVILLRMPCSLLPAVCSRALPIMSMPYRNMAMPPIRLNTLKMLILGKPSVLLFFFSAEPLGSVLP